MKISVEIKKEYFLLLGWLSSLGAVILLCETFQSALYYRELNCTTPWKSYTDTAKLEEIFKNPKLEVSFKKLPFYEYGLQKNCSPSPGKEHFNYTATLPVLITPSKKPPSPASSLTGMGNYLQCYYRKRQPKATRKPDEPGELEDIPETDVNYKQKVEWAKFCPRIEVISIGAAFAYIAFVINFALFLTAAAAEHKKITLHKIIGFYVPLVVAALFILAAILILVFAIMAFFGAYSCGDKIDPDDYKKDDDWALRACRIGNLETYRQDWLIIAFPFFIIGGVFNILCALFGK